MRHKSLIPVFAVFMGLGICLDVIQFRCWNLPEEMFILYLFLRLHLHHLMGHWNIATITVVGLIGINFPRDYIPNASPLPDVGYCASLLHFRSFKWQSLWFAILYGWDDFQNNPTTINVYGVGSIHIRATCLSQSVSTINYKDPPAGYKIDMIIYIYTQMSKVERHLWYYSR